MTGESEPISERACRAYQEACRKATGAMVEKLESKLDGFTEKVETKIDDLARTVAGLAGDMKIIKDRLRINGEAYTGAHVHHRNEEPGAHPHVRIEDVSLKEKFVRHWREILLVAVAAIAGERVLSEIPKFIKEVIWAFKQ